jgi:hypothetical protein
MLMCAPSLALGASAWRIDLAGGPVVMSEISPLTFRITNTGTETAATFVLGVRGSDYDIEGGEAPVGWVVSNVNRQERQITYRSLSCDMGLAPGAAEDFELHVLSAQASSDQTREQLVSSRTYAMDCSNRVFPSPAGSPTWSRVGLSAQLAAAPRTLDVGGQVTLTLSIVNHSTNSQSALAPAVLAAAGTATFSRVSGPTPASLSLAPGATGTFSWTYSATERGVSTFSTSARNSRVSSPMAVSPEVGVGIFPAACALAPSKIISGQTVTVVLTVSNNTLDPFQNVQPTAPVSSGIATAILLTGPMPESAGSLPAGSAMSFTWTYEIDGAVGDDYAFQVSASALRGSETIESAPVGMASGILGADSLAAAPNSFLSGSSNVTVSYTVGNGSGTAISVVQLLAPDPSLFTFATNPYGTPPQGWRTGTSCCTWTASSAGVRIDPGESQTFSVNFSRIGTVTTDTISSHRMDLTQADGVHARVDVPMTVVTNRTVPPVSLLVALAGQDRNTLTWTNPADHDGVLVVRSTGAAPNQTPVAGRAYSKGETLGNATVVYSDTRSYASSFADQEVVAGTRYYYRVFNHDGFNRYGSGDVPSSAGIFAEPTTRAAGTPLWCYSTGFPSMQQPVIDLGAGIFTSGNVGAITANLTSSNPALDGAERWRPTSLGAAVQSRFPVIGLEGKSGRYILVGDQAGKAYAVNAQTGKVTWTGNGGAALGDAIQAPPGGQLRRYSNAAFQTANPGRDLIFFSTRNSSHNLNQVFALSSVDGSRVWSFDPKNLDIISGGLTVDTARNRLFVPSRTNGGQQPSVRVVDSITGGEITPPAPFSLGDVDYGITLDYLNGVYRSALVTSNDGKVHAIDLESLSLLWSVPLDGPTTNFVLPLGGGFLATLQDPKGAVERWSTSGTPQTRLWSTPVSGPSGVVIDYTDQKVFVGSADGTMHQLDLATGADEKQVVIAAGVRVGGPALDSTARRLHVGTLDGRICAVALPLP